MRREQWKRHRGFCIWTATLPTPQLAERQREREQENHLTPLWSASKLTTDIHSHAPTDMQTESICNKSENRFLALLSSSRNSIPQNGCVSDWGLNQKIWKAHFLQLIVPGYSLDENNNMMKKMLWLNKAECYIKLDDICWWVQSIIEWVEEMEVMWRWIQLWDNRKEQEHEICKSCRLIWFKNLTN